MNNISWYRCFINIINIDLLSEYENLNLKNKIEKRVKAQNSIQYKIDKYTLKNNGEIPINKCLNDIYGTRIILNKEIEYDLIKKFVEKNFQKSNA